VEVIVSPDPTFYQSRHGLLERSTLPTARLDMDHNPVKTYPVTPPNPVADLYRSARRPEAADAGAVASWPPSTR